MSNRFIRNISAVVCMTMLLGLFSFIADIREASAAVTRVAVVTSLKGTVTVKKTGGKKAFNAFKNMSLNEGDTITTGKGASIVLQLADKKADKDEISVGENSQVNFSKLEDKKGTKAKMNVWAGSLWVKVKSISNADDTFEIETPTAIMGVRGTNFFIGVDPATGMTNLFVASGIVRSQAVKPTDSKQQGSTVGGGGGVMIFPAQQAWTVPGLSDEEQKAVVDYVNIEEFLSNAPSDIIEAMLKNLADVQRENDEFADRMRQSGAVNDPGTNLDLSDPEVLARYRTNVDNALFQLLKSAVDTGKINEATAKQIIDGVNREIQDPAKQFDLNREVPPIDRAVGVDPAAERQREQQRAAAEKKRQQQVEQKEQKKQEVATNNAALIQQITQAAQEQQRANQRAQQQKQQEATDRLLNQLSEQQRNALQQRIEQKNEQQREQQTPTPPIPSPSTPPTTPAPSVTISAPHAVGTPGSPVVLDVNLSNFTGSRSIYGYQVDVAFDQRYFMFDDLLFDGYEEGSLNPFRNLELSPFKVELHEGWQPPGGYVTNAVDHYYLEEIEDGLVLHYAVLKYSGNAESITNGTVVKLPFLLNELPQASGPIVFTVTVTPVDANGNAIAARTMTVNVQVNV